ncbi:MAG: DNA polymerase III subunit gamma/tau [Alphaproteobacteria bacterium]|nr:DNA polymerase III subunit gamma/tau [Alphaproteobacteria bacterium]
MAKKASDDTSATQETGKKPGEYRVLARKYRPQNFSELKGQDALVRTLTNAIETGRIAHAFMLTGVRGVGKTTTARIIARALNCEKGPTVNPCGVCEQCRAIAEDRHVDVLEIDAASHTGVDNMRDLIDTVKYAPVSGRYKVFVIDEVHMLSKAAFNALLKTLEEPPEHVKFVFATTEIRKVPVTVLSRCQRFDLRRIDAGVRDEYFNEILKKENVQAEPAAVSLIARAADGSARDGLSLMDQAISREPEKITEAQVREMLGLIDRSVSFDLFEALMKGENETVFALVDSLYKGGADPVQVLQDLLELTHYLTKVKVSPEAAKDQALPEAERVRGAEMAQRLSIPALTRTWQMLLKGVSEVQYAASPQHALEMVLIRLLYVSDQPTPGDLMKQIKDGAAASSAPSGNGGNSGNGRGATVMSRGGASVSAVARQDVQPQAAPGAAVALAGFADVVALFAQQREMLLQSHLVNDVHLVKFEQGHISLRPRETAPNNLAGLVSDRLGRWTGQRWVVSISREQGEPTIAEQKKGAAQAVMDEVTASPMVAEVLRVFPGAKVIDIRLPSAEAEDDA